MFYIVKTQSGRIFITVESDVENLMRDLDDNGHVFTVAKHISCVEITSTLNTKNFA